MSEKMKLKITKGQHHALNQIRGLQQDALYMVMGARLTPEGYFLVGTEDAFDHLLADLYDEVEFAMQPKTSLKHLRTLIYKLEPEEDF